MTDCIKYCSNNHCRWSMRSNGTWNFLVVSRQLAFQISLVSRRVKSFILLFYLSSPTNTEDPRSSRLFYPWQNEHDNNSPPCSCGDHLIFPIFPGPSRWWSCSFWTLSCVADSGHIQWLAQRLFDLAPPCLSTKFDRSHMLQQLADPAVCAYPQSILLSHAFRKFMNRDLTGTIPTNIGNLTNLVSLYVILSTGGRVR